MKRVPPCKIEGCNKKSHCQFLCSMHYARLVRHGDPLITKNNKSLVTWEYLLSCSITDEQTECIEWQKAKSKGYGAVFFNGKTVRTHCVSYILNIGNIPDGLFVCHHCDNKLCINPEHLFVGTQKNNIQDAISKGRMLLGEKNGHAKLTKKDIISIRQMDGFHRDIAKMFGVSRGCISHVKRRSTWKHIA